MNGLHTRKALQRAPERHAGDTKPIDRHIALICALGLLVIIVMQVVEMVTT